MLTWEPYGAHFSVGGPGRRATDPEVTEAVVAGGVPFGELKEVTTWWIANGQVNPYVRHFINRAHAERVLEARSGTERR